MREVIALYAPRADELTKKVNETFQIAEKQGNKIYKTQYVYASMDRFYCFIEYDNEVVKKNQCLSIVKIEYNKFFNIQSGHCFDAMTIFILSER